MIEISWWKNDLSANMEALNKAFMEQKISQGDLTQEFEKALADFFGVKFAVCVSSGSAALACAYLACGLGLDSIKNSNFILTSNLTFVATANAAKLLGAGVCVVDSNSRGVIDCDLLEKMLQNLPKKPKIIVPVAMNGVECDFARIENLAKKYEIEIVVDACQAFGSRGKNGLQMGLNGRFACFSLGMAKLLSTGGGGFITAHTQEDYNLLRRLRNQGVFDVRAEHTYKQFGFNFKFTDLQAAIGLNELKNINAKLKRAKEIYDLYFSRLNGVLGFLECKENEVPMRVVALSEKRDKIFQFLKECGIFCALESAPLNCVEHLDIYGDFPKSEFFEKNKLILPSGPSRSLDEINIVCDEVLRFFGK